MQTDFETELTPHICLSPAHYRHALFLKYYNGTFQNSGRKQSHGSILLFNIESIQIEQDAEGAMSHWQMTMPMITVNVENAYAFSVYALLRIAWICEWHRWSTMPGIHLEYTSVNDRNIPAMQTDSQTESTPHISLIISLHCPCTIDYHAFIWIQIIVKDSLFKIIWFSRWIHE